VAYIALGPMSTGAFLLWVRQWGVNMTAHVYVVWRLRVMEFLEHTVYSHVPHNDFSVNAGTHVRWWSYNVIIQY